MRVLIQFGRADDVRRALQQAERLPAILDAYPPVHHPALIESTLAPLRQAVALQGWRWSKAANENAGAHRRNKRGPYRDRQPATTPGEPSR